ncbi:hypothetical protein LSUB1_G001112 [Lachnellula subtilissima]|uniref:Uncharacterized protein n=1 Tax=Lachnellula subtilissima TaxID=602034 RepID=A0A8H8RYF2_9HELO|nr:hypothetical protein LSUB1_G001112 [Lachnellula subtilissima]
MANVAFEGITTQFLPHQTEPRPQPSKSSKSFKQKQQTLADSWEDEDEASGEDTDRPLSPQQSADYPNAPPPTPISPSYNRESNFISPYGYNGSGTPPERSGSASSRPEKTDAVAKRMIAGALGVRAPKKTEEQRAYEKAVKEKEIKRRNQEKEAAVRAKEQAEKAKAAIWED